MLPENMVVKIVWEENGRYGTYLQEANEHKICIGSSAKGEMQIQAGISDQSLHQRAS